MGNALKHQSVLLDKAVALLLQHDAGYYIDGTFGRGGHSRRILSQLGVKGQLQAFDKDPAAIAAAETMMQADDRLKIVQTSFANMSRIAEKRGWMGKVNGILLDLGVSSPQLDDPQRGFSFMKDGPLDMRMNPEQGESAALWLAHANVNELADVMYHYGDERFARRMARAVVAYRSEEPITTTKQLAQILAEAHPRWQSGKHPATRAFQGMRIYINRELDDLQDGLQAALDVLLPGGRLVVISFHSLEDRMVKRFMRQHARGDAHLPTGLPVAETQLHRRLRLVGKASRPTRHEITMNPRARSATMRVAEKL